MSIDGGTFETIEGTKVRWRRSAINQDAYPCEIDGPLWKGEFDVSATQVEHHGSLEAAVRFRLRVMTTRGDPALQWYCNYPEYKHAVKNTSDRELSYDIGMAEKVKIGPGEVHAILAPTKWTEKPSRKWIGAHTIEPDYEGRQPYKVIEPKPEVVSVWDTRTWIAPEKSLRRIDKIARY